MTLRVELPSHRPRPEAAKLALDGIRVIDFTHFISGPVCTLILADFGAEVIKIENATRGDDLRAMQAIQLAGEGGPFLWANRNKQSVGIDLTLQEGREIARRLIATADIVVENFSAGVMERLGLDYASVSAGNPRLIYCSISAFGREGELAKRAGFDPVVQAEGGLMSVNGHPDSPTVVVGTPVVDLTTGMMASNAILAALAARSRHGIGQLVEIAMFDQAVTMLAYLATNTLISGENPVRVGNEGITVAPAGVFETADGSIYLCCANDRTYQRLAIDVLDRPDLATHTDYATAPMRAQNRTALRAVLTQIFATDSREAWLTRMRAASVPVGPVATVSEVLGGDVIHERGLLSQIPHPTAGMVPHIVPPFRLNATPVADPRAAPTLGQHTDQVMSEVLHYDNATLDALARTGVFGPRRRSAGVAATTSL
jgi:crotonobetainyl-CoA:carnitine CoA-transferase CaiB-like acyl-CoA transferase